MRKELLQGRRAFVLVCFLPVTSKKTPTYSPKTHTHFNMKSDASQEGDWREVEPLALPLAPA